MRWWQLVAQWKDHDRHRQFGWSAADQADNNIAYMAVLASTFESASRFECVDESSAQATTTMSTNIVALSYRTFCLVYILVYYACRSAICIAYGDFDGGDEDDRNGARSAVRSGGYCAAKTTPPYKTCALRVLQRPLRPSM